RGFFRHGPFLRHPLPLHPAKEGRSPRQSRLQMAPHSQVLMRAFLLISLFLGHLLAAVAAPLPIDPLWQSDSFRKAVTGSFGIHSRIEPLVTTEEQEVLKEAADKMAAGQRREAIATLSGSPLLERSPAMLFNLATLHYEEGNKEAALTHF